MSYAIPALGIAILAIPLCIGLAYLIGYSAEKINVSRGLNKDDISSPVGKFSLWLMIVLGSIALIAIAVIFVVGTFLGWDSPI